MTDRGRVTGLVALCVLAITLTSCTGAAHGSAHSTDAGTTEQAGTSVSPPATGPETSPARTPATTPGAGRLLTRRIPGGTTGFKPRPAVIYLPPAARTHPHERFPVLVLLHGTDGTPANWVARGGARATLDRFAAAHKGRAPVVVMPDINGSLTEDTECVRTANGGNVERYLLDVVPAWIRAHLPVTSNRRRWGIAGASEGGTCALVLGLRSYPGWGFVGDFAGLRRLTVGDTDDPATTIDELFGGSRKAYDAHDPAVLLRHRFPHLRIWFECGTQDTTVLRDQTSVAALARRSVESVRTRTTPGRHTWAVMGAAFIAALPWFWAGAA